MREFHYQELKNKQWDNEVVGYLAHIHEFMGKQALYNQNKPQELKRLLEIASVQSTEASNSLEGIVTTNARIKQLMAEKTMPKSRAEEEISGYRDVLKTIHENYEYIPILPNYILQFHKNLYRYSQVAIVGRYKNVQNYISETRADGSHITRFVPLAPFETSEAMERLCSEYNLATDSAEIDPLILIPVFIVDFLCIHPFNDGNGRMSRLLTTLLLYRAGYEVGKYISLEKKIEQTKVSYYDALQASSTGRHECQNDYLPFVKYLLGVILAAYRDLDERITIVGIGKPLKKVVLQAIESKIGKFTKREIVELCPSFGRASVENALSELVAEGVISRHGKGRATFYTRV